jgi:hypothetical protein
VELVDEGKILRALDAQLVEPAVILEDNGFHDAQFGGQKEIQSTAWSER